MRRTAVLRPPWAIIASCGVLILAALLGPHYLRLGQIGPLTNSADFRAFYCAGKVVASRGNPMLVEPLRTCEQQAAREMGLFQYPLMVNAAPQPPYSLIAFSALSFVPFKAASCVWLTFLLLCTVGTVSLVHKLTNISIVAITLVTVCGNILALLSGELGPVVIFGLVLAAYSLARSRPASATTYAIISSMVPHIAVPAWIAISVLEKKTRGWFALWIGILAIVPFLVFGPSVWTDYFTKELPIHALSEAHALQPQYSLTMLLVFLGVPVRWAISAGQVDYLVMFVVGVIVAKRLSLATKQRELIVLIPPAFVVLGGVFIHLYQLAIVFPAAFCLMSSPHLRLRNAMIVAMAAVLTSMVFALLFGSAMYSPVSGRFVAEMHAIKPDDLASGAMRYWHESQISSDPHKVVAIFLMKVPAVFGLCVIVGTMCRAAFRRDERFEAVPYDEQLTQIA